MRHVLICLMLGLTLLSQFWIIPRMDTLRASVGDFATVPLDNPARVQFDALHVWSTRVEGAVLVAGIGGDLFNRRGSSKAALIASPNFYPPL